MGRDIHSIVGGRIREERKRAGLTIEQLAELAGISTSFLAYIETRGRKASLDTIEKLTRALRLPIAELFNTVPGPQKDTIHAATLSFAQLIRDRRPDEIQTVMEIAKATVKGMSRSRGK